MTPMQSILYAEDQHNYGEIIQRLHAMVHRKFHEEVTLIVVPTWDEMLMAVEAHQPSVVLLDLTLPPMDSNEVLEKLTATVGPSFPPVMVLTGDKFTLELRKRCIMAGADDFMLKDDANHLPELLCERIYHCYLRRLRDESRT